MPSRCIFVWHTRRDLNSQPLRLERSALPNWATSIKLMKVPIAPIVPYNRWHTFVCVCSEQRTTAELVKMFQNKVTKHCLEQAHTELNRKVRWSDCDRAKVLQHPLCSCVDNPQDSEPWCAVSQSRVWLITNCYFILKDPNFIILKHTTHCNFNWSGLEATAWSVF